MPIAWSFTAPAIFNVEARGTVTFAEARDAVAGIQTDPRLVAGAGIFVDARGVVAAPDTAELRILADMMPALMERGVARVAIVAERSSIYGVARMFSAFAALLDVNVRAFRRVDEAKAWLDAEEAAHLS